MQDSGSLNGSLPAGAPGRRYFGIDLVEGFYNPERCTQCDLRCNTQGPSEDHSVKPTEEAFLGVADMISPDEGHGLVPTNRRLNGHLQAAMHKAPLEPSSTTV
jgi:hypothetical protein